MRHALLALALIAAPAIAQPAGKPGAPDVSRVQAGTYTVDPNHTQVLWSVDHMGFSVLQGAFGSPTGTLTLDPKNPAAAKLSLTFPMTAITTTSAMFKEHLSSANWFDVAKYPEATFVSTKVAASGRGAQVTGNLTIKGVTRPVTLQAKFYGAGTNPMSKATTVGFSATGTVRRSDFGLGAAVPVVDDQVQLTINGAFEKQS
ncbi:YceI family protein [uncultured Sphingomonas sp.]|uniref:YceI family protein n=1 Tax=uncultured Sphingomonas sp. TaxID=158754 RepID=UPI0025F69E42|nr:YceI family protein [uncultured Sphingomonas sp.]